MAVHSNDGKTWSTKLDRIGKLSASNKDMVFNNLGGVTLTNSRKAKSNPLKPANPHPEPWQNI